MAVFQPDALRRPKDALDNYSYSLHPVAGWHGKQLHAGWLDTHPSCSCHYCAYLQPALRQTSTLANEKQNILCSFINLSPGFTNSYYDGVNPMNKEQISGKFDQVAGKIKQNVGEAVNNQKLANAGAAEQIKGAAKETWGRVKDTANDVNETSHSRAEVDGADLKQRAQDSAHDVREKVTSAAQNVKDKISNKLDEIKHKQ
jgi:uncharacterized protein YjbJ (UPF0337 family)